MIYVYVAKLPLTESAEALSNIERQAEINSISNERVRREKYYVWRLLEYAMRQSLGIDPTEVEFKKTRAVNGHVTRVSFHFRIAVTRLLLRFQKSLWAWISKEKG